MFYFHPYLGKIPILTSIFFKWAFQPPTRLCLLVTWDAPLPGRDTPVRPMYFETFLEVISWIYPPPSNSGKWRFRLGFPTKNVMSSWWWLASWVGGRPKLFHSIYNYSDGAHFEGDTHHSPCQAFPWSHFCSTWDLKKPVTTGVGCLLGRANLHLKMVSTDKPP